MQALKLCRLTPRQIIINSSLRPTTSNLLNNLNRRRFSSSRYARSLSIVHWTMGLGVLSCFALIEIKKREPKGSPRIGPLMHYHKSIGLLMAPLLLTRVGLRLVTKIPKPLDAPDWMQVASKISHYGLYGFMIWMPATGIAMGYYGGKGLPFFWTKVPGAEQPNKSVAKFSWQWYVLYIYYIIYIFSTNNI